MIPTKWLVSLPALLATVRFYGQRAVMHVTLVLCRVI
jgi:hypothetical protein